MTTARDIMNAGVTCVGEHETLTAAAQYMRVSTTSARCRSAGTTTGCTACSPTATL